MPITVEWLIFAIIGLAKTIAYLVIIMFRGPLAYAFASHRIKRALQQIRLSVLSAHLRRHHSHSWVLCFLWGGRWCIQRHHRRRWAVMYSM